MTLMTLLAALAVIQTAEPAPAAGAQNQGQSPAPAPALGVPVLDGAQAAPDCGGVAGIAGQAFCVTAPLGRMELLAEAYVEALRERSGWLPLDGTDNRIVFVRRKAGGGCEALQMLAFLDTVREPSDDLPAFLAFATVPGDPCAPGGVDPDRLQLPPAPAA